MYLDLQMELGDACGGIFELVNTFYLKEDAFKHLELPLEFCHHGGAWEPLLPTKQFWQKKKA